MFNDNYSKVVSRNYTSQNQVQDAGLPSSGNDLGYRTKSSGVIGRLIPVSYQHLMGGSKFSGKSFVSPTLDQMSTPIAPDMLMRIHNFIVPYFAVNRDFRDIMTTNPENNFNKDMTIGLFNPLTIFQKVMLLFPNVMSSLASAAKTGETLANLKTGIYSSSSNYNLNTIFMQMNSALSSVYSPAGIYVTGAILDLRSQVASRLGDYSTVTSSVDSLRQNLYSVAQPIIDFFFGEHSLFDNLGYPYVSHEQLRNLCLNGISSSAVAQERVRAYLMFNSPVTAAPPTEYFNDFALRCYQAVWIDFYRNVQIQKKIGDVLDYHKWDNSMSLDTNPTQTPSAWQFQLLITRICPWNEDVFTSAQLDDIMRHIYMPVTSSDAGMVNPGTATDIEDSSVIPGSRFMTVQAISYNDVNGVPHTVNLPIPTLLNKSIHSLTYDDADIQTYGFDLFSMKRAQMLERFLKRGHYFGNDEYRDIMKGRYGVDISDLRLNRPHFLGGATNLLQLDQHISTAGITPSAGVGQDSGSFGQRIVTGNGHLEGNTFTDFSEEWAITLSLFSIIPDVQYDPLCIQNTQIFPQDYPDPILCENFEAIIPTQALARNYYFISGKDFGHAPSAFQYRQRVNEVHGRFLDEFSSYTAARFFGNSSETTPKLNSIFLECRPYLGFFVNTILLDGQFWFVNDNEFYVENPLPSPVEVI